MNWRDAVRGARWRAVSAGCIAAGMLWAAAGSAQTGKTVATAKAASTPTRTDSASPAASSFVDEPIPKPVGRQEQSALPVDPRQAPDDSPGGADPIRESSSWPLIVLSVVSVLATMLAGAAMFVAFVARRRVDELAQVAREKSAETSQDIVTLSANLEKLNHRLDAREQSVADLKVSVSQIAKAAAARTPEPFVGEGRAATPPSAARTPPAMAPRAQPAPVSTATFLAAVQDAADAALADGIASDTDMLTTAITGRMPDEIRRYLATNHLKVSAHNSSAGLLTDFNNPDFLSVTKADGNGVLLPNPRATYAHSFVKYYDGDSQSWPRFVLAAQCSVDASGKASLTAKGRL